MRRGDFKTILPCVQRSTFPLSIGARHWREGRPPFRMERRLAPCNYRLLYMALG